VRGRLHVRAAVALRHGASGRRGGGRSKQGGGRRTAAPLCIRLRRPPQVQGDAPPRAARPCQLQVRTERLLAPRTSFSLSQGLCGQSAVGWLEFQLAQCCHGHQQALQQLARPRAGHLAHFIPVLCC